MIYGEHYKHLESHTSSLKHRKVFINDTGNEEIEELKLI